jgi:PEP-CTERM motif
MELEWTRFRAVSSSPPMNSFNLVPKILPAVACLILAVVPTQAQVLVSDTFIHANGSFIPGGVPDTGYSPSPANILGGTYQVTGGGGGDGVFSGNAALMHNGGGVGLAMGSYNDNANLAIAADISFLNLTAPISLTGYALLGFNTAAGNGNYSPGTTRTTFTGLQVALDGNISLFLQGVETGSPIAYGGIYNPAAVSRLTYTVNTTTGAISNISFGSSLSLYSFVTTGFTQARTEYVGIGGSLGNVNNYAVFDNFTVTAVPEPSALMLALGGVALLGFRRNRK